MDTGVLISAFAFGGIPQKAVKKALRSAEIFVSPELLREYRDVPLALKAEDKIDHSQMKALISGIATVVSNSSMVQPLRKLSVCRDPKDDMLLDCCLAAHADFLITGDKDLCELSGFPFKLKITTPSEYVKRD